MSTYVDGRKGLVTLLMVLCLLLAGHSTSARSEFGSEQGACGPSMQGVDRLRADLGLDNALANRANTLAAAARQSTQPPPANEIQSLTEDSFDGLKDAGDQLDQAADEIGKQLDTMNLPRQRRAWGQALDNMKKARTKIHYPTRQELTAGSTSATGIGPKVMYEAANDYQSAVQSLNSIADQSGFVELGQKNWIAQGSPDTAPPPNPGPDPWQEWLKRLQAQQARIRNNINGLNAARALQAGQFQQAQRAATDMRQAVQDIQNVANQLGQLAALCNQASANQRQPQRPQPSQPSSGGGAAGAATGGAAAGGGGGGAALVGLGLVGAGAGGYLLYQQSQQCKEPVVDSELTACFQGKGCSYCAAVLAKLVPYCDCIEQKHPNEAAGVGSVCRDSLSLAQQAARYCVAPKSYTPLPRPIAR